MIGGQVIDRRYGEWLDMWAQISKTKEAFSFDKRVGYQIHLEGLRRGIFIRPLGSVIYFIPPLVISISEIQQMIDVTYDCVGHVLEKD